MLEPGPASVDQLAIWLHATPLNVRTVLQQLQQQGHVKRAGKQGLLWALAHHVATIGRPSVPDAPVATFDALAAILREFCPQGIAPLCRRLQVPEQALHRQLDAWAADGRIRLDRSGRYKTGHFIVALPSRAQYTPSPIAKREEVRLKADSQPCLPDFHAVRIERIDGVLYEVQSVGGHSLTGDWAGGSSLSAGEMAVHRP